MKTKYFALIFLVSCLIVFGANSYAGEVRTVSGTIESVKGSSIEVSGTYYDIYGVPLLNSSGHEVARDQLETGKIAEIFLEDGKITRVKIHDYIVE